MYIYVYDYFRVKTAQEIIHENQRKLSDLENEVWDLKLSVEKKEHAIKSLRAEKNLNRYVYFYVYFYFINNNTVFV
jgi:hypothetical protein